MMRAARRRELTEHDRTTWAIFVQHIRPLDGVDVPEPPPSPPPVSVAPADAPVPRPPVVKRLGLLMVGVHPPGLDRASWERFRTGKVAMARTLDLHGRTAARAFVALQGFLGTAHAERLRCVEVITGRGAGETGGVIRREFPLWLNLYELRPMVLAAAHPHAANQGSVRLLLRRPRPGRD